MEKNISKPPFKAYVALTIVCILWGTTYLAIRIGVEYVPGFMMAGIRNTIAGIITFGYFLQNETCTYYKEYKF